MNSNEGGHPQQQQQQPHPADHSILEEEGATAAAAVGTKSNNDDDPLTAPTQTSSHVTKWQHRYAGFASDVLLYIVILNLASELVPNITIERFSISLFVAIVLKLILDAIQYLEHAAKHLFCDQMGRKVLGALSMWLIVFSSKFLILWVDDVIFGSKVELGYFWEILILSAVLLLSSLASRCLFDKLGEWDRTNDERENASLPRLLTVTDPKPSQVLIDNT